jgi:hypothetical protein
MKVMQHQKTVEKNADLANAGESQKEQLKLMLDAMWATNALDIQNTVAKACAMVCHEHIANCSCCRSHPSGHALQQ